MSLEADGKLVAKQLAQAYRDLRTRAYEVYLATQAKIVAERKLNGNILLVSQSTDYKALKNDQEREYYLRSRHGKHFDDFENAVDALAAAKYGKELAQIDVDEARALLRLFIVEAGARDVSDQDA